MLSPCDLLVPGSTGGRVPCCAERTGGGGARTAGGGSDGGRRFLFAGLTYLRGPKLWLSLAPADGVDGESSPVKGNLCSLNRGDCIDAEPSAPMVGKAGVPSDMLGNFARPELKE